MYLREERLAIRWFCKACCTRFERYQWSTEMDQNMKAAYNTEAEHIILDALCQEAQLILIALEVIEREGQRNGRARRAQ